MAKRIEIQSRTNDSDKAIPISINTNDIVLHKPYYVAGKEVGTLILLRSCLYDDRNNPINANAITTESYASFTKRLNQIERTYHLAEK